MAAKIKAKDLNRPRAFWQGFYAAKRDHMLEEARICRERNSLSMARSFARMARTFNGLSISYGKSA